MAEVSDDCAVHCWHFTGLSRLVNQPLYDQVCCRCGRQRSVRTAVQFAPSDHGPYAPPERSLPGWGATDGC